MGTGSPIPAPRLAPAGTPAPHRGRRGGYTPRGIPQRRRGGGTGTGTLAAEDETIAELRRRAEVAEAELEGARLRLAEVSVPAVVVVAGQEATERAGATATTPEASRPVHGLWRRLRRALGRP